MKKNNFFFSAFSFKDAGKSVAVHSVIKLVGKKKNKNTLHCLNSPLVVLWMVKKNHFCINVL